MAIQIPRIQEMQNTPMDHAPRLDQVHLDAVTPEAHTTGTLEGVAKETIRLHQELADQTADTLGTNARNEHQIWRKKRLYGDPESGWVGYANMTGADPQELYKKFDKEEQDKLDQLSKAPEGQSWSQETQNVVNRRLSKSYEEGKLETLTQYSHQKKKYDDAISDTGVGLAQQAMYSASSYIDPKDESSFDAIKDQVTKIRNIGIAKGLRNGGAVIDENGETAYNDGAGMKGVNLSPIVKKEIASDIANGLSDATKNLVDSHDLDKAKALKEWADKNGLLDTASMGKIDDKLAKAEFKHEAYAHADEALKKGAAYLDTINDPEMRVEAKKIYNEEQGFNEKEKARKSKLSYDALHNHIAEVMRSSTPYKGDADMENDPVVAKILDNVTDSKQKQALYNLVEQPRNSAQTSVNKVVDLFTGKDDKSVIGMDQATFNQYLSGLNKHDRNKYQGMFEKANIQSNSQQFTQMKNLGKEMDDQAIGAKLLSKMPNSPYFTSADQVKEKLWRAELLDKAANYGPMTPDQMQKFVAKFIVDKKAGEAFTPPIRQTFNGGQAPAPKKIDTPAQVPAPAPKTDVGQVYGNLTPAARMQFIQQYRKANNGHIPNEDQLIDFIKTQVK